MDQIIRIGKTRRARLVVRSAVPATGRVVLRGTGSGTRAGAAGISRLARTVVTNHFMRFRLALLQEETACILGGHGANAHAPRYDTDYAKSGAQ